MLSVVAGVGTLNLSNSPSQGHCGYNNLLCVNPYHNVSMHTYTSPYEVVCFCYGAHSTQPFDE